MVAIEPAKLNITGAAPNYQATVEYAYSFSDDEKQLIRDVQEGGKTPVDIWSLMSFKGEDLVSDEALTTWQASTLDIGEHVDEKYLAEDWHKFRLSHSISRSTLNEDDGWFNKRDEVYVEIRLALLHEKDGVWSENQRFEGSARTNTIKREF